MTYFLSKEVVLKWLETPSVYNIKTDELYELDEDSFEFLKKCQSLEGSEVRGQGSEVRGRQKTFDSFIEYCLREGILTREKIAVKRPPLVKSPVPSLRYLEMQITDRCNLRCRHCYIGNTVTLPFIPSPQGSGKRKENPPLYPSKEGTLSALRRIHRGEKIRGGRGSYDSEGGELSIEKIRNILTGFEEMQGLRVMITGGEPLLHSRFDEINEMLPDFFVRKILFTNGLLLNREILGRLNVDEIQISIDGLENAHELLRGKGTFKKAIKAVKLSIDSGYEVSVSTMVHSKNLDDFDGMERLFRGLGIKDWTVDVPCITGELKRNAEFQVTPEQAGKFLGYGYGEGLHAGESGFACGLHLMSISADGSAAKCTFYSDKAVGLIDEGLRKCWKKIMPVKLDGLKCDCEYIEACRGGCRYRAEIFGDALGKDLYRCALYDIIKTKGQA